MDILLLIFKIYLNNKINMILKFMLKLVKYFIVIWSIWLKYVWRVVNASKKMRFKTFFIKKSHLIFVWRKMGKHVLSQFLKILEKCLNSIEISSLDSVHQWAHYQILFIIFREFSSSSGCFFRLWRWKQKQQFWT